MKSVIAAAVEQRHVKSVIILACKCYVSVGQAVKAVCAGWLRSQMRKALKWHVPCSGLCVGLGLGTAHGAAVLRWEVCVSVFCSVAQWGAANRWHSLAGRGLLACTLHVLSLYFLTPCFSY